MNTMRHKINLHKLVYFWIFIFIGFFPLVVNGMISRNLKLGDRGEDVRELQQLLNRDGETLVANIGPGSRGHETAYFGKFTEEAVRKFQKKHATDVLYPLGLSSPTGFVGFQTRLNLLRFQQPNSEILSTNSTSSSVLDTTIPLKRKPEILSISPDVIIKNPQEVLITGANFSPTGNTVFVSSEHPEKFSNIASVDGKTLRFMFSFSTGERLKRDLKQVASSNYDLLVDTVSKNIKERLVGFTTARIPVVVVVKNGNGESATKQLVIDVTSILKDN